MGQQVEKKAFASQQLIVVCDGARYVFSYPEIDYYMKELQLKNADEVIDGICKNQNVNCQDAQVVFTPHAKERFAFKKEVIGKKVDREKLKKDILETLKMGGGVVRAKIDLINPTVTEKMLKNATSLRSGFTTYFANVPDRINNIVMACKSLNGLKINAGETFSFNKIVGVRSEQRGYKMAKIIVNGEFVMGVGGGVCQVSTTLYNAALLSGLEIVEHHRHTLAVSYVEPSFDAMVNADTVDLKFKNNTKLPIFIETAVGDNHVSINVYGEKMKYSLNRNSEIVEIIEPTVVEVESSIMKKGEKKIVKNPKNGIKSVGYLSAFDGEKLVWKNKIRDDVYLSVNGVVEVGTNG